MQEIYYKITKIFDNDYLMDVLNNSNARKYITLRDIIGTCMEIMYKNINIKLFTNNKFVIRINISSINHPYNIDEKIFNQNVKRMKYKINNTKYYEITINNILDVEQKNIIDLINEYLIIGDNYE